VNPISSDDNPGLQVIAGLAETEEGVRCADTVPVLQHQQLIWEYHFKSLTSSHPFSLAAL
jgi:hypothetical protein